MPARFPSSSSLSHSSSSLLTLSCTFFVAFSLLLSIASPFLSASLDLRRRNAPLLQQLQSAYPYNRYNRAKFPTMIWQTWKDQVNSPDFDREMIPTEETWSKQHPSHVHLVVDDKQADDLVKSLFSMIPQVYEAYSSMLLNVHRADFFRYLILFAYGGTYSDIDTRVLRPVWEWHPHDLVEEEDLGIVIGIEADPDRPDWHKWYARRVQFCQWTIRSKPGHPILARIIAKIVEMTLEMKANDALSSIDDNDSSTKISTMEYTGPGIWTDTVFEYLGDPKAHFTRSDRTRASPVPLGDHKIGPLDVTGLQEQKLLGDVMLLPITSFSPGIGHMGSKPVDHRLAFVFHQFKGTWKEAPPGKE